MAIQILSGGRVNDPLPQPMSAQKPVETENQEETYPQAIARNIYRGGKKLVQLAGIPGSIAQAIAPNEYEKTLLPSMQSLEENVFKPFEEKYLPKDYGKAKSDLEDVSDLMFQAIPMIAMGGWPALASATGSALAIKGSEKLGAGPLGQFAAGLAGGMAPRFLMNRVGLGGIRNKAITEYKKDYEAAKPFAKKNTMPAQQYNQAINQEWDLVNSGTAGIGKDDIKRVAHEITLAKKDVIGDNVNVLRVWDRKKHLNNLIKAEKDPEVKKYFSRLVGKIKETILDPASEKYPEFGTPYKRAEDLFVGVNAPNAIRKVLEKSTDLQSLITHPLAKMGLLGATGGLLKGGLLTTATGAAGGAGVALGTRYLLRAGDMFWKSKEARKIMKDIGIAAINDNKAALAQYLSLLNKEAQNYDQETTGINFVSGGLRNNQLKK